jgi:protein-tyrosine phosphatase
VEGAVDSLADRRFDAVLAHPERCPLFQRDPDRLARLVDRGVMCSITAGSMTGRFGDTVRSFTIEMLRNGWVHDVASDAHDHLHRPPGLTAGFGALEPEIPGLERQAPWYTVTAPVAILAGNPLPRRPDRNDRPASGIKRLLGRSRR